MCFFCGQTADHQLVCALMNMSKRRGALRERCRRCRRIHNFSHYWALWIFCGKFKCPNLPRKQTSVIVRWSIQSSAAPVPTPPASTRISTRWGVGGVVGGGGSGSWCLMCVYCVWERQKSDFAGVLMLVLNVCGGPGGSARVNEEKLTPELQQGLSGCRCSSEGAW